MVKQGILVLLVYFVSLSSAAANLEISDAWIRYLPSVIPVRSGYMVIRNNSPQAVSIIKFESEVFTQIDIHETVEKDGMMTMRPVMKLNIPAGQIFKLAAGGFHLMMANPDRELNPGDRIDVTLKFESGESQLVEMTVKKLP